MFHYSRIFLYGESFCFTHLHKIKGYFILIQMSENILYFMLFI
ncbi:hypothetical protein BCAH1134_C0259 (plasmid) [Bacillus cereus AH1134]|nr:hypothetical protein BCAH1134_C0259 [Bacillus cereus AH1134]